MFTDDSLLSPDFDTTAYLRHALQVSSTSFEAEQLRLSRCLEKIETEIHATVQNHRDALIGSVQEVGAAQRTTASVLGAVDQLESSVRRLRHGLHEPFVQMQQRVHELRNLHACLSLVRNVQRYLNVASKLREQVQLGGSGGATSTTASSGSAGGGDIVRAARLLREVEEIEASSDLAGLPFVDAVAPQVSAAAQHIRQRLTEALRSALSNGSAGELSVCLQCACSTGSLSKTVQGVLAEVKRETSRALVRELDNAATSFGAEMDAEFRNAIFSALERALLAAPTASTNNGHQQQQQQASSSSGGGGVAAQLRSFGLLWTVLRRKRDPASDVHYWWQLPVADRRAFDTLWTSVVNQVKERLTKLSKRGAVLVAVSTDFGRLHMLLRDFLYSVRETLAHVHFDGDDEAAAQEEGGQGGGGGQMALVVDDLVAKLASDFEPRFRLSLQDRLRDKMSVVLGKLATMRPGGGGSGAAGGAASSSGIENTPIDIKADVRFATATASAGTGSSASSSSAATRTAPALVVHPAAAPIDARAFFKVVANEITNARSDDGVLAIAMRAVCDEIEQFTRRCNEVLRPLPVPELPRVSAGHTTAGQLFHMQLANAASAFVLEMQSLGTLFPASAAAAVGGGSGSGGGGSSARGGAKTNPALEQAIAMFGQQVDALVRLQQQIIQPYFNAGAIVLLQAVDSFVQDYYERGAARPATGAVSAAIRSRVADFAARYALLFDARAGTVAARACHSLAGKLLQRFTVRMLLLRGAGGDSAQQQQLKKFIVDDCNALQDAVNVLHPLERLARRLSQLRAVRSLALAKTAQDTEALLREYARARFHPAVVLLAALQQVPAAASPSLASQLKVTQQQVTALVEALLSAVPPSMSASAVFDTPSTALPLGVASSNAAATATLALSGNAAAEWDRSKWRVLFAAVSELVADVERGVREQQPDAPPLCDASTAKLVRDVCDAVREV